MKNILPIRKTKPLNIVLNKTIDKDVQSIFLPLNLLQLLTLYPKYRIKNDMIKANSIISNIYSILGTVVILFALGLRVHLISSYSFNGATFLHFFTYYDSIFYSIGFIMNCIICIFQTRNIIDFVLTFQNVHRFLKNDISTRRFIITNWVIIITFLSSFIFFVVFTHKRMSSPYLTMFLSLTIITFDLHILYATRVIMLLKHKLDLWNLRISHIQEVNDIHDHNYKLMWKAFVDILKCYNIYKKCFQLYVSVKFLSI